MDETTGRFDYDCSGFLDYALRRVDPAAYRELPVSRPGSRRPLAQDFYALFSSLNTPSARWEAVPGPAALRPGDLVSWLKPPDNDSNNTGHVMLVRARPRLSAARPDEWLIDVIDSTTSPHAQDSRPGGSTGLGTGTVGVIVNARGDAVAFRWRGGLSRTVERTPIAFGRLRAGLSGKP